MDDDPFNSGVLEILTRKKPSLKLYGFYLSGSSRAVQLFCMMASIENEWIEIDVMNGEHFQPSYLTVNPRHSVPCMDYDHFVLTEGPAILRFLCDEFGVDDHWYPKDRRNRSKIDEYLDWHAGHLRRACSGILSKSAFGRIGMIHFHQQRTDLDDLMRLLTESLATLEGWLSEGAAMGYIGGREQPSIADVVAVCELESVGFLHLDLVQFPLIELWQAAFKASADFEKVHERVNATLSRYLG